MGSIRTNLKIGLTPWMNENWSDPLDDPLDGVRLVKDLRVFLLAVLFVVAINWLCYNAITSPTSSGEEKKWAMSILSASAGGLMGYLVRK